ncbi:UbiH/UbiF/VisC/COQ6 family ubiquinone biosynthesis hydroxylase [Thioflexithrix psekupsensis]|uniref:FAD-binding domain-containing protein n=1 Tax=Thioflexithrix psekupsensis TaxID=1570016 RepID=A0A251XBS2_9GAMM|nr:UbiH/UbiF/VisC/COQ6 family ubiquinone biosynthesis hydroxylase [Thioflexithrix psekupsensis]OUD16176.1 hypothetical protein TPSD3_00155 [Thioflexithrix psekupsensis]
MQTPDYEVLIAGSGVVGSTLACALLSAGLRVGLIETRPAEIIHPKILDLRVFALTRASERIFRNLGVWDDMEEIRVSPFRAMEVWDNTGQGQIFFDSKSITEPTLGYIVEQNVILAALNQRLATFAATEDLVRFQPDAVTGFSVDDQVITVKLVTGMRLTARLLVAAEGANSPIRTLAGIPYHLFDYAQQGLVANVHTTKPHDCVARQRFLEKQGILAFLPLKEPHQTSIVWSCPTPQAQALMNLTLTQFQQTLTEAFDHRLGQVEMYSERAMFPLARRHAERYVQARLALVGDAAHTIHPLAGQGVNLGLLDVACLAEVLLTARQAQRDVGDYAVLRRYERWRRSDNALVQSAMDGFKIVFAQTASPVRWLRNVGLNLTHHSPFIKNLIMQQAMGLKGDLPELARYMV